MRIGIDLGGSKIEGLVLGPGGEELARARADTPQGDYEATVAAVAGLVAELVQEARTGVTDRLGADQRARTGTNKQESGADGGVPVGVGIPGALSPATGRVKNANSTCLIGHAFGKDLEEAIGRPVRLANDADCFTISEATDGAGKGLEVVFGVILGTGCGGGVAVDGKLVRGPNAIAGEWGHNPLPWPQEIDGVDERPGPECYCGKRGCIETFVSGPGLERDFLNVTGKSLTAAEIVVAAEGETRGAEGRHRSARCGPKSPDRDINNAAEAALTRYEHRLARALATIINVLDPGVIVLGGGMSNARRLYRNVPELWGEWVFSDTVATPLRPAAHGDSSGVRGAAWLW